MAMRLVGRTTGAVNAVTGPSPLFDPTVYRGTEHGRTLFAAWLPRIGSDDREVPHALRLIG